MTYAEIKEEVRRRLQEVSATWWTDDEVADAIKEAEFEFADSTEWYEVYQTIDILEDRPYYDLRHVLRRSFLVAGPTFNDTTQRWLIPVGVRDMDINDRRWEQRVAEPEFVIVRGLWWLKLWPHKGVAEGSVKQYFRALPTPMSADTDEPGFHRFFHYGIVEYAVADLLAQDAETDLAMASWSEYKKYEGGLSDYVQGRASVPALHAARAAT